MPVGAYCRRIAMEMMVKVPDELAEQLPQILELGIREWKERQEPGYRRPEDVLEALAKLPTPEEVLALRPSRSFQLRIGELLEKNRTVGLLPAEQREWDRFEYVEHLVRLAKARATMRLKRNSAA
jgi:hypothetical protein